MPSFDVVSEVDLQEVDNAINQSKKEIETRYDFRGSKAAIEWDGEGTINISAEDDMKIEAISGIINQKMVKRGISVRSLDYGKVEDAGGMMKKQQIKVKQGISVDNGKKIVKIIKDQKLKKIQAQIQQEQVRVTGPKRDDLQNVIALLKDNVTDLELQFVNFRD